MADRGLLDLIILHIPGLSPAKKAELCLKFDTEADFLLFSKRDIEKFLKFPGGPGFRTMD
jgi:hypothetical protein